MNIIRNSLIVSLLVVLVLPTSFAFAAGIEDVKGLNYTHCESNEFVQTSSLGLSGDDLYDSAADLLCAEASVEINTLSANPELSIISSRYQGMADAYAVGNETDTRTALEVISVRYQGLADAYATENDADFGRALETISARYQGMADAYNAGNEAGLRIALQAISNRYQAQAELFLDK